MCIRDRGYFTGGMCSFNYFALGDHRGFERGMDEYHAERAALHVAVNGPMESHGSSSREITDDAIKFVDAHRGKKFFLWIHYYDPHLAYEKHPEVPPFGPSRVDGYDGEIRFTDLHLGRLIAHLRAAAGHVDSAPTLVNLARGAEAPSFIGRSLLPDVTGPPAPDTETRAVFQ